MKLLIITMSLSNRDLESQYRKMLIKGTCADCNLANKRASVLLNRKYVLFVSGWLITVQIIEYYYFFVKSFQFPLALNCVLILVDTGAGILSRLAKELSKTSVESQQIALRTQLREEFRGFWNNPLRRESGELANGGRENTANAAAGSHRTLATRRKILADACQ